MDTRTEFGQARTSCACKVCVTNCRVIPGYLIPSDLRRMIPAGADPFKWAEANLLASPGALVIKDGELCRIGTLVPAKQADGSCMHLQGGRCDIHETSPFGCAFFDCSGGPTQERLAHWGLFQVANAAGDSLYKLLHAHLKLAGKIQDSPEKLRRKMRELT